MQKSKENAVGVKQNQKLPWVAKHFTALIRHGERSDEVPGFQYPKGFEPNPYDPCLTPLGMQQGKETG